MPTLKQFHFPPTANTQSLLVFLGLLLLLPQMDGDSRKMFLLALRQEQVLLFLLLLFLQCMAYQVKQCVLQEEHESYYITNPCLVTAHYFSKNTSQILNDEQLLQ